MTRIIIMQTATMIVCCLILLTTAAFGNVIQQEGGKDVAAVAATLLAEGVNSSSSSGQVDSVEVVPEPVAVVTKKPAVKFANADGAQEEPAEVDEFRDRQQRILRNNYETQEAMRREEEAERMRLRSSCFYVEEEFCQLGNFTADLPKSEKSLCPCKPHPYVENSIICCNVTSMAVAKQCYDEQFGAIAAGGPGQLHIRNATLHRLEMNDGWWKRFDRISVTDGHVDRLSESFPMLMRLACLNVSNNQLTKIDPRILKTITEMSVLDLSYNNLTEFPHLKHIANLTVTIRANGGMMCKVVQEAVDSGMDLAQRNRSMCSANHNFKWFYAIDAVSVEQLYLVKALQKDCPEVCKCTLDNMKYEEEIVTDEKLQTFNTVKVDCSNASLVALPERLPANTFFLNVSHNNLTNLKGLDRYVNLVRLYADHNQISSLLDLEGTSFKEDFEMLSLRYNKLKQIPVYLLSRMLDKEPGGKVLYFGGNKLNCDCNSAELRMWLLGHQSTIKDSDMIMCENMPGQNVTQLSVAKLCQSKHDAMDYIVYLIAAEIILLLALILKVSYDYYVFKTQSYLPWPANKMPKLPCDWLCES